MINSRVVEDFVNDLSEEDIDKLVRIVGGLDPLVIEDDAPKYDNDEIDLIQRVKAFVANNDIEDEDDGEDDGDVPGTGEDPE